MSGFDLARTHVDLIKLLGSASSGNVDELLLERPDWPDSILFGTDDASPLFHSWLEVTRHNWRNRISDALEASLQRFEASEFGTRQVATALLVIEPSHERALQKLVEHHAKTGNVALATKIFKDFEKLLDEQYQITPSAETLAVVRNISSGGKEKQQSPKEGPPKSIPPAPTGYWEIRGPHCRSRPNPHCGRVSQRVDGELVALSRLGRS